MRHRERGRLVYQDENGLLDLPPPKLFGRHQFDNAGVAIAALRSLRTRTAFRALRGGPGQGRLAGAAAAPVAGRWSRCACRAASCGSTAGTIPTAGARSRRRWPTWKSACRARWSWSSACCRPRTATASCAISPGSRARHRGADPGQDKGVPPDDDRRVAPRRHSGDAATSIEQALASPAELDLDPPPRILITGSLYLAGEVLAANGTAVAVAPGAAARNEPVLPSAASAGSPSSASPDPSCTARRLVGSPAQQPRAVPEALAAEVVVADLDHQLGLERLPLAELGRPAARAARRLPVKPGGAISFSSFSVSAGFSVA